MPGGDENLLASEDSGSENDAEETNPSSPDKKVPELALDRVLDIVDFEIEHILWDRMARKEHHDSLEVCAFVC